MQMLPPTQTNPTGRLIPATLLLVATLLQAMPATAANHLMMFAAFDELLLQNVRNGFVDYDGLAADPRFAETIGYLATADATVLDGADGGLAFYINAYNALAIQGVLNGLSPSSWWGRQKFFKRQKFRVLGEKVSLATIEHERIIVQGDARIHFALVCASLSCPRLSSRAYQPEQINLQLHDAARRFINDPTRNRFDLDRRIAFVSMIFDWYSADFEKAAGSLQKYLARFVDNAETQEALRSGEFEIRYEEYDWSLNGRYSRADP